MAQDSDVARVAAALKAPGIRYKSFGNDPVRGVTQPVENVANSFPLLGAVVATAVALPMPPPEPQADPQVSTAPEPEVPGSVLAPTLAVHASPNASEPAPRHHAPPPGFAASPPPGLMEAPPLRDTGGAAAGRFPFGAPPAYPEPAAPYEARDEFPGFSAAAAPPDFPMQGFPRQPPFSRMPSAHVGGAAAYGFGASMPDSAPNSYRLLESLGRRGDPPDQVSQPPSHPSQSPAGTFGSLPGVEAAAAMQSLGRLTPQQSGIHHPGYGQIGQGQMGFSPPAPPAAGTWPNPVPTSALLPAAMVTLPLAEVMRLVAVGAPVVSSPFAAFRVSGGVPNSR